MRELLIATLARLTGQEAAQLETMTEQEITERINITLEGMK